MKNANTLRTIETARAELKAFWALHSDVEGSKGCLKAPPDEGVATLRARSQLAVGVVNAVVSAVSNWDRALAPNSPIPIGDLYKKTREGLGNAILDELEKALKD
jgi:hypothetical protein